MFRKNYNQMPTCPSMPMVYPNLMMYMRNARQNILPPTTTGGPDFEVEPGPPVKQDISYTQGWLTTQIGKYVKIEFLIGTTMLIDREGILVEVGISYVVIREAGSNDLVMCDIYSIKFVRIVGNESKVPPR